MEPFKLEKNPPKTKSINRTIRFTPEVFDKIEELHEKTGMSFSKICAQCIEYALKNLDENTLNK